MHTNGKKSVKLATNVQKLCAAELIFGNEKIMKWMFLKLARTWQQFHLEVWAGFIEQILMEMRKSHI